MSRRIDIFTDVGCLTFLFGLLAASIGGALFVPVLEVLSTIASGVSFRELGDFVLTIGDNALLAFFGLFFGFGFGVVAGLVDGCVMGGLMATGIFQPRIKSVHRWFLCGMSALVTATCIGFEMQGLFGDLSFGPMTLDALSMIMAAIGGWWVAYRVLTREPHKKKNDGSVISES